MMAQSKYIDPFLVDFLGYILVELLPCDLLLPEPCHIVNYLLDLLVVEVVFQLLGYALQVRYI